MKYKKNDRVRVIKPPLSYTFEGTVSWAKNGLLSVKVDNSIGWSIVDPERDQVELIEAADEPAWNWKEIKGE